MYKKSNRIICMGLMLCMTSAMILGGCGQKSENSGKIEIELVQYKPEAVKTFEKIEEEFNATHDDIHLTIESPNDAMTVLKHVLSEKTLQILSESEEMSISLTLLILIC